MIRQILDAYQNDHPVVLATIVSRRGSAPRTSGAQMLIHTDGSIQGTIGGGLLEAQCMLLAKQIHLDKNAIIRAFHLTGKDAAASDMICGGDQEVLLEYINPADQSSKSLFLATDAAQNARNICWWITKLPDENEAVARIHRWVVLNNGEILTNQAHSDEIRMGPDQADRLVQVGDEIIDLSKITNPTIMNSGGKRYSVLPYSAFGTVYIFGAGHVSQQLASITTLVGFRTVIVDDRPEFVNSQRFPNADELILVPSFYEMDAVITYDPQSYLVIVTRGHLNDKIVLEKVINTNPKYIGMIGSRRKVEAIYQALEVEGYARDVLNKIHAPIGIEIEAESPEEIAVSITAELIKVRAQNSH